MDAGSDGTRKPRRSRRRAPPVPIPGPSTHPPIPLALLLALAASVVCGCAHLRPDDPWLGRDKAWHFGVSAAVAGGATWAAREAGAEPAPAVAIGVGVSLSGGLAKERHDRDVKRTYWSWKDLAWDALGAAAGAWAGSAAGR